MVKKKKLWECMFLQLFGMACKLPFDLSSKVYVSVLFVTAEAECVDFVVSYGGESIVNVDVTKVVSSVGKSKGSFPRCSASPDFCYNSRNWRPHSCTV